MTDWMNQSHDFWDQTLLKESLEGIPESERRLVIIPGTLWYDKVDEINNHISGYPKVLVIVTSDEENKFPIEELSHPDLITYVMYASLPKHRNVDRFIPIGYPPMDIPEFTAKKLPWFFAGQVNHEARQKLVEVLRGMSLGRLVETPGFSQGLPKPEYYQQMAYASVVPSPGGSHSPDSFRIYEALELGAIPIPDHPEFWKMMYGDVLFPALENWGRLKDLIENLKDRPEENNKCFAWWQRTKKEYRYMLEDDLEIKPEGVTVLVATSPIKSHPNIEIIEQTIQSVRERLPNSEIILMFDGVRDEQEHYKDNYIEYTRRLLWKANHEWKNIYPIIFDSHQHQANMTREALKHVRTPTILFMEHDTPLMGKIPFNELIEAIESRKANLIRFHYEAQVLDVHKHLMLDSEPKLVNGVPMLRCAQWSQRPHIASTEFYKRIIDEYFPVTSRTMIEDRMYGVLENAWFTHATPGWNDFKVWMYAPEGDIKRSLNLDGREDDPKFEMKYD